MAKFIVRAMSDKRMCVFHASEWEAADAVRRFECIFSMQEREGLPVEIFDLAEHPALVADWQYDGYRKYHSGYRYT